MSATPDATDRTGNDYLQVAMFLRDYRRVLRAEQMFRSKQVEFKALYGWRGPAVPEGEFDELIDRMVELDQLHDDFNLALAKLEHSEKVIARRRTVGP